MKMPKKVEFALKLFIFFVCTSLAQAYEFGETRQSEVGWAWRCENGVTCKRQAGGIGYNTQDECKLICGAWGPLWPRPSGGAYQYSTNLVALDVTKVTFVSVIDLLLNKMENLFFDEINLITCGSISCAPCDSSFNCFSLRVNISVTDLTVKSIEWGIDESYALRVTTDDKGIVQAVITAETVFGARHALQSLSQMIVQGGNGAYAVVISSAQIPFDTPKYTHRGLLVDTSRHFFPIPALQRTIDAMSTCKLNTLHLHLTDSHSFPFKSEKVPQMSQWGAYSEQETYTSSQLTNLAKYALARGVRIIPELDAPAHAGNGWQWGPDLGLGELAVCVNQQPWKSYCIQPPCGQLNPGNENVYKILKLLYSEMHQALHPHADTVFHMGADEVVTKCWRASATVSNWIASQPGHENLTEDDYQWAWVYFQNEALKKIDEAYNYTNPSVIVWSSGLTNPLKIQNILDPTRYVVQTWVPQNQTLAQDLLNLGYKVIVSNKDAWYLDWGFQGNGLHYSTWKQAYYAKVPTQALGGEACAWSELIDDYSLDSIVWPRTAAVAERLWSDPSDDQVPNTAESRLLNWRRRIIATRRLQAAPITPQWCSQHESACYRNSNVQVN